MMSALLANRTFRPSTIAATRVFAQSLRKPDSRRVDEIAAVLLMVADAAENMREIQRTHHAERTGCLLEIMSAERDLDEALRTYTQLIEGNG